MSKLLSRTYRLGALVVVGMLLISVAVPNPVRADGPRWHAIYSNNSVNKCLDVLDWNQDNGATITQWDCHHGRNQEWQFFPVEGEWSTIRNVNSGKCLDVLDWNQDNGAVVTQWDCHGGANQQWKFVWHWIDMSELMTFGAFVNRNSGKCLDVFNWSHDNGATITQWDCHDGTGGVGTNQEWGTDYR